MSDDAPIESAGLPSRWKTFTPARVGIGAPGLALPTDAALRFQHDHARARDAVWTPLDVEALAAELAQDGWATTRAASQAESRATYLRRPDLGRRLTPESYAALAETAAGAAVALIAADGLSSAALAANLTSLLAALRPRLSGLALSPVVLVSQGRVAIGDEIAEALRARLAVVLIGERPGLSAADSLGAYITYDARPGVMDSQRNCVSNIRTGGLPAEAAAAEIASLVSTAFSHRVTGVALSQARGALPAT